MIFHIDSNECSQGLLVNRLELRATALIQSNEMKSQLFLMNARHPWHDFVVHQFGAVALTAFLICRLVIP